MKLALQRISILVLAPLMIASCGGGGGSPSDGASQPLPGTAYTYTVPADVGDGWVVAALADEGFATQRIVDMMTRVLNGTYQGIDSVVIARNNKLLLYWFADRELDQYDAWINNTDKQRHVLHSTSKSFTSALVGIAIDQGFIASTQVKFYDLFGYTSYQNPDPRKAEMTLEDALTMQLGLEWDEWTYPYTDSRNDLATLTTTHTDWAKALLDLPITSDPGTGFTYNTAATNAIGQAVQNAVRMPLARFADLNLFLPMGITNAAWARTPTNLPVGGSGLFLRARDLAKFGQLYLDNGSWQGQQIISEDWIADSVVPRVDVSSWATYSHAYGFQWWLAELDYRGQLVETWITSGYGGQYMFVVPSLELVVAFTGHNYEPGPGIDNLFTMMRLHILDSID